MSPLLGDDESKQQFFIQLDTNTAALYFHLQVKLSLTDGNAMSRTTRVMGFSVPPRIAEEVEQIAREENRTKSELFREMLRVYKSYRNRYPEMEISEVSILEPQKTS